MPNHLKNCQYIYDNKLPPEPNIPSCAKCGEIIDPYLQDIWCSECNMQNIDVENVQKVTKYILETE